MWNADEDPLTPMCFHVFPFSSQVSHGTSKNVHLERDEASFKVPDGSTLDG